MYIYVYSRTFVFDMQRPPPTTTRTATPVPYATPFPSTSTCWNRVAISGSAHSINPRHAGTPVSRHSRKPQSSAFEHPSGSVDAWRPERCGRITVPIATQNMPSGHSSSRPVYYSQVTIPPTQTQTPLVFSHRLTCTKIGRAHVRTP